MFKQVLNQRREYVRQKLKSIVITGREHAPRYEQALRGGMLSELTTIECILAMIEKGDNDPLDWWVERLTEGHQSTESA